MRTRSLTAGLAAALFLFCSCLASAAPRWARIGPDGGLPYALAAAPSRPGLLYVGLYTGGVFRSADRGVTWRFARQGLGFANNVYTLAVDATAPATAWAGTNRGLFKTTDGGASWTVQRTFDAGVSTVTAHPRLHGVAWVSTFRGPVFETRDGGATWRELPPGSPRAVMTLAVDPLTPSTLYAGTFDAGVFKSGNGGATWKRLRSGLPADINSVQIVIDPHNPRVLFLLAATFHGRVFKSTNGGATWTRSDAGLDDASAVHSLAIDAGSSAIAYVTVQNGVFRTTNGGRTWRPIGPGSPSGITVLANAAGVFVGDHHGIAVSTDHGSSWRFGRGLSATRISFLAVAPEDPPRLYAAEFDQLWKTISRGAVWQTVTPDFGDQAFGPGAMAIDPAHPETLTVGLAGAFIRSTDRGQTWSLLPGLSCIRPTRLRIDPQTPSTLYSSGGFLTSGCGLQPDICITYKSTNGGASWSCIKNGLPSRGGAPVLALDPFAPSHLFATDRDSGTGGLFRSLDTGASWSLFAPGIFPLDLAFDRRTPGLVYAALANGVGRSTDGGATWEIHAEGLPVGGVFRLALDPDDPSVLYAAAFNQVFRSADAGRTWEIAGSGLGELLVDDLAIDPKDPKILYAATDGGGVLMLRQE
jgi:photosystem II stability/assembly factor-like uncharacterized protein